MAYFDNAATTYPKPEEVYEFMDKFYRNCGASYGRGDYASSKGIKSMVDETRDLIRDVLHCPAKEVIFTPTATIALNIVIQGLIKEGKKNIYISPFEHNAVTRNLYPFSENNSINVFELSVTKECKYDLEKIRYQFDSAHPDVVIVSHASNVTGLIAPIEDICTLAKKYKAINVIDMSQTAGLVDVNIGLNVFDFAIFAGHKTLYGPTGISGFVIDPNYKLPTVILGGTGFESARQDMPDSIPERFEMGTMNISGLSGLNAAVKWIKETRVDEIRSVETKNRDRLLEIIGQYPWLRTVGIYDGNDYVGIVSCVMDGISSDSAGNIFDRCKISVRTGLQCAPSAHRFLNTFPAGTIRFSVGYFTSEEDFAALSDALEYIDGEL